MYSKTLNTLTKFVNDRVIELLGIVLVISSVFLLLSIMTYTPSDPNFLYTPEENNVSNLLGTKGSFVSDFFLQSIGLLSFLLVSNILIWGVKLVKIKSISNFLSKAFFTIAYILTGTLFITIYKDDSFWLIDNGNGGFVGKIIYENFYNLINSINNYYIIAFLFFITLVFYLLSIDLKIKEGLKIVSAPYFIISKLFNLFKKNKKIENINEDFTKTEIESVKSESSQPDLPFKSQDQKINSYKKFKLPPLNYLEKNLNDKKDKNIENLKATKNSELLEKILSDFGVDGKIKRVSSGPVVVLNEFEPAAGVRVSQIINLSDDIARYTSSVSTRVSTIPGKNTVGIEIPNPKRENVFLSEIISDPTFNKKDFKLPIALGKNISGSSIAVDLTEMPHLLIAGTTGSGKSVCVNSIIMSLLYKHSPDSCNLILIDPKMLELSTYEGIPHLLCPVITDAKKATAALSWTVREMENRYKLMTKIGVKNIDGYNLKNKKVMPYIVVIVDEMSDLMLVAGKEIENYIQKLSQMARAAGIHIIMATQRPSVDVITGTIKANFPTRISFQVSSKIDSRTILGEQGAEQLLGKGDMLFMSSANRIVRIHGPFVSESEIEKVNSFLRSQGKPDYFSEITETEKIEDVEQADKDELKKDKLYLKALELVKLERKASTSFLQRKLQIGYNRAARIIDMMEEDGVISKANHVGKREIL